MTTRAVNQAARKRMADTGEPYTAARRAIQDQSSPAVPQKRPDSPMAGAFFRLGSYSNGLKNPVHWGSCTTERAGTMVIYGRTGSGKSVLAATIAAQAVQSMPTYVVTLDPDGYFVPGSHDLAPRRITPEGEVGPAPVELDSLADNGPTTLILDYPDFAPGTPDGRHIPATQKWMDAEDEWHYHLFSVSQSSSITVVMIRQTPPRPESLLGKAMDNLDVTEVVMGATRQFAVKGLSPQEEQRLHTARDIIPHVHGLGTIGLTGHYSLPFLVDEPLLVSRSGKSRVDWTMPARPAV